MFRSRDADKSDYKAETFQGYSLEELKSALTTEERYDDEKAAENYLLNIIKVGIDHVVRREFVGGLEFTAQHLRWYSESKQHRDGRVKLLNKLIKEGGG